MKSNQKQINYLVSLFALIAVVFFSCKKDKDNTNASPETEYGFISGRVHTPNNTNVGSALIIAGEYNTKSNAQGEFILRVPTGFYKLKIQTGSGHVFKSMVGVEVKANDTLRLSDSESLLQQIKQLAFIPGAYDRIETIIIDSLGYAATAISVNDLDNLSYMQSFGGIFFDCGKSGSLDSLKYTNISNYLVNGGSIYASDWAIEYLTGDGSWRPALGSNTLNVSASKNQSHEAGYSTMATCLSSEVGGFIPDSALCASKSGAIGLITNALINDPDIVTLLGKDSVDIEYNLGSWEKISHVDIPFTTMIEKNNPGPGPLAVSCDLNGTAFGGRIIYTTFHNHPQGNISTDVKLVLQHFILSL